MVVAEIFKRVPKQLQTFGRQLPVARTELLSNSIGTAVVGMDHPLSSSLRDTLKAAGVMLTPKGAPAAELKGRLSITRGAIDLRPNIWTCSGSLPRD